MDGAEKRKLLLAASPRDFGPDAEFGYRPACVSARHSADARPEFSGAE